MNIKIHFVGTMATQAEANNHLLNVAATILRNEALVGHWLATYGANDLHAIQIDIHPPTDEDLAEYPIPDGSATLVGFLRHNAECYDEPWFVTNPGFEGEDYFTTGG